MTQKKKKTIKTPKTPSLKTEKKSVKPKNIKVELIKKAVKKTSVKNSISSPVISKSKKSAKTFEQLLNTNISHKNIHKTIAKELLRIRSEKKIVKIYTSPYAYIYADYLKGKKYEKVLRIIENRLTDLGINGRIHRLSQFKNLEEIIEEDIRRGITTVVVVGDDTLVKGAIDAITDTNVTLGILPVGQDIEIANLMGIPQGVEACNILSQRIIEMIDIGNINGRNFFSSVEIKNQTDPLLCDEKYELLSFGGDVVVYNLKTDYQNKELPNTNPRDGLFEVLVNPRQSLGSRLGLKKENKNQSLIFAKKLSMESNDTFVVYVDGKKNIYRGVEIQSEPQKLKIIVGKNRLI